MPCTSGRICLDLGGWKLNRCGWRSIRCRTFGVSLLLSLGLGPCLDLLECFCGVESPRPYGGTGSQETPAARIQLASFVEDGLDDGAKVEAQAVNPLLSVFFDG